MAAKPPGGGRVGVCWVALWIGKGHGGQRSCQPSMRTGRGLAVGFGAERVARCATNAGVNCGFCATQLVGSVGKIVGKVQKLPCP